MNARTVIAMCIDIDRELATRPERASCVRGKVIDNVPGADTPMGIDFVILPDRSVQCSVGWAPIIDGGKITGFRQDPTQTAGVTAPAPGLNHHPTYLVYTPQDVPVRLDRGIARVVQRLWDHGIETFTSCQGGCAHDYEARIGYYTRDEPLLRSVLPGIAGVAPEEVAYQRVEEPSLTVLVPGSSGRVGFARFPPPEVCPVCEPEDAE